MHKELAMMITSANNGAGGYPLLHRDDLVPLGTVNGTPVCGVNWKQAWLRALGRYPHKAAAVEVEAAKVVA